MKLKIYFPLIIVVASFFLLVSCKKSFLEVEPKGRVIAVNTNEYRLLMANLGLLNTDTEAQVPMGDEVAAIDDYFSSAGTYVQRLFTWEPDIYDDGADANEMVVPSNNIYTYNKIINEVPNSLEGSDAEKKSLVAEAKAARAWTNFLLINYYGNPYSEATASNSQGYPIITNADVNQTVFKRGTVKEMYDFIIKDLQEAIPNLSVVLKHRMIMCKPAAEGILGKVYTFMGRYAEAIPLFDSAFAQLAAAEIPATLYDYNRTFATGGIFLPIGFTGPSYPTVIANTENIYAKQFSNTWGFINDEIVLKPETVSLYGSSDFRLNFSSTTAFADDEEYPLNLRRLTFSQVNYGVILPDLYLLRAECLARTGSLSKAINDVVALRIKRMPPEDAPVPSNIATNQQNLVKFIIDERIREFAATGYRWFDMRRLSVDPLYNSLVNYTHRLYSPSGTIKQTFTLKPERLTLRFPTKVIQQNPGMENNP